MVEAGGIGEGGRATAGDDIDMDGVMGRIVAAAARAEARRQRRWRQPTMSVIIKKNSRR
jgi:hypothetical protein